MNDWTRVSTLLPALLGAIAAGAGCARVTAADDLSDAGPSQPGVASVEPRPGPVPAGSRFTVRFSTAMDAGALLASSGRSESVVLAAAADAERAAAAISRGHPTAAELALFVPAAANLAPDQLSLELVPEAPLRPGSFFLLVSPRLKDTGGHKLAGNGARFGFDVAPAAETPRLLTPPAGTEAPLNLARVRVFATDAGVSLVDAEGAVVGGPVSGPGEVFLPCAGLRAGGSYELAIDGARVADAGFAVSACRRAQPPAFSSVAVAARDTSVAVEVLLDWPAMVRLEVSPAAAPCPGAGCVATSARVECAADACAPQRFSCAAALRLDGLAPSSDYVLTAVAEDDEGHTAAAPPQPFSTLAELPRLVLSEVMIDAQPSPRAEGQYVEILNLGPGAAALDGLALAGPDGTARPLLASAPPLPVVLAPGQRALATGDSFDSSRYPQIPPGTPILRSGTQRLLGRGLSVADPQRLDLVAGSVVLAGFPGGAFACESGQSLQRDESAPPEASAKWGCGQTGGTPGAGP